MGVGYEGRDLCGDDRSHLALSGHDCFLLLASSDYLLVWQGVCLPLQTRSGP